MSASQAQSSVPSLATTPAPSSPPPPSESYLSDIDGAGQSLLDGGTTEYAYDAGTASGGSSLNLVSWKLDVNARDEDGVEKRGFNAISTVLNHPTKKANPLRGTKKPLPPIAAAPPIPKLPPASHYDSYLKSVTPLYESFVNAQASSSTNGDRPVAESSDRARKADLVPLDNVPQMFFDDSFDLSSPSTWSSILNSQDDLSTHLDTLESHLLHEITLRSTSFFSALSNLQDLHSESASCLNRITDLQGSLKEVGEKQARKGLSIIEKQEDLWVLRGVETGVTEIGEIQESLRVARSLIDGGDWAGGLGCLEDAVKWWDHHSTSATATSGLASTTQEESPVPLSSLSCLSNVPSEFSALTALAAEQLESALSSLLCSILSRVGTSESFDQDRFKSSVQPMLSGLVRCSRSSSFEAIWREAVTTSIREGSRKHLPVAATELEEDDGKGTESRGMNLAESLRSMDHSRYLLLTTEMYSTLLSRLHLVDTIGVTLVGIIKDSSTLPVLAIVTPSNDSPAKQAAPSLELSDILSSACELANARAAKILGVRAELNAALSITEFVELFKENWEFVVATETLAKRMIVSLRGVTASQARTFLIAYHGARLTKSAKFVEEEQWTQVDVGPSLQHTVNLLISAATDDPAECFVPPGSDATTNGNGDSGAASTKQLSIEDNSYYIVKATSETMSLLSDYLKIVINLELVVMDVMSRIIEFLKSFNSRTCQVVLGAGAMRSAGLKNITAKHLALASQSLSIVVALIPYIREFIRRHLNPKQAVMLTEFDKLKRDYQEHQNEIHAKLVAIMSDRLAVHVGSLREIDWEAKPEKEAAHSYAEFLVKETATLHKVLSKYLATSTVESVLAEVLGSIVTRLSEEYTKIELKSDEAKKRMLLDVTVITQKLGSLAEAGKNLTSLQMLVKDKPVPRKNVGQTMAGLLKRNGSKKDSASSPAPEDEGALPEKDKEEGDGDEDGESLGIIPAEDQTEKKDDVVSESPETPAPAPAITTEPESETAQPPPPALPEKSDRQTGPTESEQPPTTPPKDPVPIQSSTETDVEPFESTAQEEAVADDILTAPPTKKDELPVAPVQPLDVPSTETPVPAVKTDPATLPPTELDEKSTAKSAGEEGDRVTEDKPEVPEKE